MIRKFGVMLQFGEVLCKKESVGGDQPETDLIWLLKNWKKSFEYVHIFRYLLEPCIEIQQKYAILLFWGKF